MKPPDCDFDSGGAQRPSDVQRARILVGLNTDHADQAAVAVAPEAPDQRAGRNDCSGFIVRPDFDLHPLSEHPPGSRVKRQTINAG
jgi:hypothetical protein